MNEVEKLQAAIRKHRDTRGDDRCWLDDEELYSTLPEGFIPPVEDSSVELARCQHIQCRHNPATKYVSPQRRIEELERHVQALKILLLFQVVIALIGCLLVRFVTGV